MLNDVVVWVGSVSSETKLHDVGPGLFFSFYLCVVDHHHGLAGLLHSLELHESCGRLAGLAFKPNSVQI